MTIKGAPKARKPNSIFVALSWSDELPDVVWAGGDEDEEEVESIMLEVEVDDMEDEVVVEVEAFCPRQDTEDWSPESK